MASVTQISRKAPQPTGGYINPKLFEKIQLEGGSIDDLNPTENVSPGLVGTAVDYLTRFMSGSTADESFFISKLGAEMIGEKRLYKKLIDMVKGLDDRSIKAAVKLTGFDSVYRAGTMTYRPVEEIELDKETIENIRTMVNRSLKFFEIYGPKVLDGITFEGGYTEIVDFGDGDFMTADTIWDFKVTKSEITNKHTLQILMYWRMGLHSIHPEYQKVKYLGFYNPRMNVVYRLDVKKIPAEVISEVEKKVIGY